MATRFKRLFGKRALIIYSALLSLPVGGSVIVYWVANARGAAALQEALEYRDSVGETLTLESLLPERIPDAVNFFATPALKDIGLPAAEMPGRVDVATKQERLEGMDPLAKSGGPFSLANYGPWAGARLEFGHLMDYVEHHGTLALPSDPDLDPDLDPARRFLAALDDAHGDLFEELAVASDRSDSQITPPFADRINGRPLIFVSEDWTSGVLRLAKALRLRAAAAAQCGEGNLAAERGEVVEPTRNDTWRVALD